MTQQPDILDLIDPRSVERARRVEAAIAMLQAGRTPREVRQTIRVRYDVSSVAAWYIVRAAVEIADV